MSYHILITYASDSMLSSMFMHECEPVFLHLCVHVSVCMFVFFILSIT